MPEIRRLQAGDTISYQGPFDLGGLRSVIDDWFDRHDRDKVMDQEVVKQDGKNCMLVFEAERGMNDYVDINIDLTLNIANMRDITVEVDGVKRNVKDGEVTITIDSLLQTDTSGQYDSNPLLYFLRFVGEKWFYKSYIDEWSTLADEHRNALKREINEYLNKTITV